MTFREAQRIVGGYLELVPSRVYPHIVGLVDEDGRMKGLPRNVTASRLLGVDIVGPAVILTRDAWETMPTE